ncbi:MAG: Gfo/Idh/MocA family protein [Paracoccaceae bacterium]
MTYLVIGSGSIGRRHHANLTALGAEVRLVPWRGLDLDALDLTGVTGVVVATATPVRIEVFVKAAAANLPLYIEKPLVFRSGDLAEVKALTASVADRSVLGLMMRYHPAVQYLHNDPVAAFNARFTIGHDVRQWRENWRFADSYAADPEGGGVLLDLCHELDMAHVLYPDLRLQTVSCLGHDAYPGVDFASEIGLTGQGRLATVAMDYLAPQGFRTVSLKGQDDMVEIDLLTNTGTRWRDGSTEPLSWTFERNDMFLDLMRDFMALAEGRPPSDTPLLPRLSQIWDSAALTVEAWEARRFNSTLTGEFA